MATRNAQRVPRYCRSRNSAVVYVGGRCVHLGPYGSEKSKAAYARVLAEHAAGKRPGVDSELTVVEVIHAFWKHAKGYYVKDGKPTSELGRIRTTMRPLKRLYGDMPAKDFGPLALKAVRTKFVDAGYCRPSINDRIRTIRRMFRWAASEELVPSSIYHDLCTVAGLRFGRTTAPESKPVLPIPEDLVQKTLAELPEVVCDMVRLQRLTGARPGEICKLRPADVDQSSDVWLYFPPGHKTIHHGRERIVYLGKKAQAVLRPYLLRDADAYCFSPAESERKRRDQCHAERKTPLSCGNRPGTNCKRRPKRTHGERYTVDSYRRAIHRACDAAGIERWSPNRLRHSLATEVRRRFGLEASQVILGHAKADVTQVYAERDAQLAARVAREIG